MPVPVPLPLPPPLGVVVPLPLPLPPFPPLSNPVPRQIIAAIKFSGWRNQEAVSKHEDVLMRSLNESKWKPTADPVAFFYDPPWTAPFLRRNEVAVTVALRDK